MNSINEAKYSVKHKLGEKAENDEHKQANAAVIFNECSQKQRSFVLSVGENVCSGTESDRDTRNRLQEWGGDSR